MNYRALPVVVKYVKPGLFPDTCYRSFRTINDAKKWIEETKWYGGINVPPMSLKKYAIYTRFL